MESIEVGASLACKANWRVVARSGGAGFQQKEGGPLAVWAPVRRRSRDARQVQALAGSSQQTVRAAGRMATGIIAMNGRFCFHQIVRHTIRSGSILSYFFRQC